jgi:transcription elongation GreA/GreB family factor
MSKPNDDTKPLDVDAKTAEDKRLPQHIESAAELEARADMALHKDEGNAQKYEEARVRLLEAQRARARLGDA